MTQELLRDDAAPYREVLTRPGDNLDYAIEWSGWLANRWSPGGQFAINAAIRPARSTGFEYYASVGGMAGAKEPTWPLIPGLTVSDGSITWTCRAISAASLSSIISTSTWTPATPLTAGTQSLTGTNATAYVTVPSNCPDGDYLVRNTITLANGVVKVGVFLMRVRAGSP